MVKRKKNILGNNVIEFPSCFGLEMTCVDSHVALVKKTIRTYVIGRRLDPDCPGLTRPCGLMSLCQPPCLPWSLMWLQLAWSKHLKVSTCTRPFQTFCFLADLDLLTYILFATVQTIYISCGLRSHILCFLGYEKCPWEFQQRRERESLMIRKPSPDITQVFFGGPTATKMQFQDHCSPRFN